MLLNYKHVIWDWNGTLLNDVALCVEALNGILMRRNMGPIETNYYLDNFSFPVQKFYEHLGFDFDEECFEQLSKEFMGEYGAKLSSCSLQKDAEEILAKITNTDIEQSILSAYSQSALNQCIREYGIDKHFEHIVGLDHNYADCKLANGKRLFSDLSHAEHEVVLVGDSVHDYEVAEALGIDCLLVSHGHNSRARLESCAAIVVDSLSETIS